MRRLLVVLLLLIALVACEDKVRVTIKVKTQDAGAAKTATTAVP
jgi:hypothetical protein